MQARQLVRSRLSLVTSLLALWTPPALAAGYKVDASDKKAPSEKFEAQYEKGEDGTVYHIINKHRLPLTRLVKPVRGSGTSVGGKRWESKDGSDEVPPVPEGVKKFEDYYNFAPVTSLGHDVPKRPADNISHKDKMTIVTSQGDRGTCYAFSATSALETVIGGGEKLSVEYLAWLVRQTAGYPQCPDDGATIRDDFDALRSAGIPNDAYWTYKDRATFKAGCKDNKPPQAAIDHATIRAENLYYYAPVGDALEGTVFGPAANNPRFYEAVIDAGYNLVVGFNEAIDFHSVDEVIEPRFDKSGKPVAAKGAHAMLVMGYNRGPTTPDGRSRGGYVLVKNSWSILENDWGYLKISYDYLSIYANGALILDGLRKKEDGEECKASEECAFHGAGQKGSACCKGKCATMKEDFANVYYCPDECKGAAGASGGTCPRKDDGGACFLHQDCAGYTSLGAKGSGCCGGTCTKLNPGAAGVYFCPPTKKQDGGRCLEHADCFGWQGAGKKGSGCCKNKCEPFKKDWAGVYYCPDVCVGKAGGSAGTCN